MTKLLDANALLDNAAKKLGLEAYVTEDVRSRFNAFVGTFNAFGAIDDSDYPRAYQQMETFVGKRLQLARDWTLHPEILEQPIKQPLFVIGHARSGTTVLQHLLGLNAGHRMPHYWEVRQPSPPPGRDPKADAKSMAAEKTHVEDLLQITPTLLKAHPFLDQGAMSEAECSDIMALDFHIAHPMHFTRVPSIPYPTQPTDTVAAYTFHKKMLQQFQWKTPTGRWVCKGNMHQYHLPVLWTIYPDATCFWTHRAPEEYFASFFQMMEVLYRPINGRLFKEIDARGIVAQLKLAYEHMLSNKWINDPRLVHIRFTDLMRDPVKTLRESYASRDIPFTPAAETAIKSWLQNPAHRSDRHGKFTYSLEQFGLSAAEIRSAFAGYRERFEL
jgi:hypothetical protein